MTTAIKSNNTRLYDAAKANGSLKGVALAVYGIICATPGLTVGEVFRKYAAENPGTGRSRGELSKRVSDLANWGAVRADGLTICPESGRQASRWVPTGQGPNKEPRLRSVSNAPRTQVIAKTAYPDLPKDLNGAVAALGKMLGVSVDPFTASQLVAQAKELAGNGVNPALVSQLKADLAKAKAAEQVAYDSRNAAQARCNGAESRFQDLEDEFADLKSKLAATERDRDARLGEASERLAQARAAAIPANASPVELSPAESQAFVDLAAKKGLTHTNLIRAALRTYQAVDAGVYVEARKQAEDQKSPVPLMHKRQLSSLAGRARLVLKFKRFMTKRMVKQAEDTLAALNYAVSAL